MNAFNILSDPIRRIILENLVQKDFSSGEIVEIVKKEHSISQPAVSQHLKVLRENGFAKVSIDGNRRIYSLDSTGFNDIDQWLEPFRQFWGPKFDALEKELRHGKRKSKPKKKPKTGQNKNG